MTSVQASVGLSVLSRLEELGVDPGDGVLATGSIGIVFLMFLMSLLSSS